ncbi:MAG: putative anti-sigma regulatory factor, serine/threonine protein kinase [Armatimonadetes bacterium]|jgi:serine/threonine-protein kinase RsbT|nr:putative anti-sigma regulatory factor, serine/threonine protein kinase [Armatimonadota bacterium]
MPITRDETMPLHGEADVVHARQAVRKWTLELKFSLVGQTKLVTAASELARNTITYGGGGTMRMQLLEEGLRRGLRLIFEDQGPGIPDVELALRDGYTTGRGLGLGLSGSKRLVNEFELVSTVGVGTRITVTSWK